jgi:hypothetical protein
MTTCGQSSYQMIECRASILFYSDSFSSIANDLLSDKLTTILVSDQDLHERIGKKPSSCRVIADD